MDDHQEPPQKPGPPSLLHVVGSVMAALAGLQSSRNRHRDFTTGNPKVYIVVGLIATLLFILTLVGVIKVILAMAGI